MNTQAAKSKWRFPLLHFSEQKKVLEEYADLVDKNIRMLLNEKKAPNDNLNQLCDISIPRQVLTAPSVQEQLPVNSGSKSKRPRKQTAVMTESLHQEEELLPKKK